MSDKIIVGKSLSCILYCWRTQTRCVIHEPSYIFRFDEQYKGYDFSFMNAENPKQLWTNLCFAMGMSSLLLFHDNVESIREEEDGLAFVTKGSRIKRIKTENVVYFDEPVSDTFGVYDFFDTRSTRRHDLWEIKGDDDFVSQINFYYSPRQDCNVTKDLVTASTMTQEQVLDPSYGNGIVRLKVLRMLAREGITGPLSVRTEKKTYYKKPKIDFHKRVVSQITRPLHSFEEVYNMKQVKGEAWKMIESLRVA